MKRFKVYHPLLFAVFPVISLYAANIHEVLFSDIILPLFVTLAVCLFFFLVLLFLLRDGMRAGAIVSLFFLLFFSYGHIAQSWTLWEEIIRIYLVTLWMVVLFTYAFLILVADVNFVKITRILNFTSLALLSASLVTIGYNQIRYHKNITVPSSIKDQEFVRTRNGLPDIYYIVFDRYARGDILKEYYLFDNTAFIDYLKEKGFYVVEQSNANYLKTVHSLASSLNLEYINYYEDVFGKDSPHVKYLYNRLEDFYAWRFLKKQGYTFVHSGSWWGPTSRNAYADINLEGYALPEFVMILSRSSFLSAFGMFDFRTQHSVRALYQFDALSRVSIMPEPTFTFAHILLPHDPFVFDRHGNFVTFNEVLKKSIKENYREQLSYTNARIQMLIETLLASSETEPIIIVSADEGPYPDRYASDINGFNWHKATKDELREKMGILLALYLPGDTTTEFYTEITPVNIFRIVFNKYFNTDFEILPDKVYAFSDEKHPFDFFEITDAVMR